MIPASIFERWFSALLSGYESAQDLTQGTGNTWGFRRCPVGDKVPLLYVHYCVVLCACPFQSVFVVVLNCTDDCDVLRDVLPFSRAC